MTKPRIFPRLTLLAVILGACSPAPATPPSPEPRVLELPSATAVKSSVGEATQPPAGSEPATQAAPPAPTSRGPNLEATDPTTVSLASGEYQFVEFFRFT